jgi:glycosyltransferase involved in cell wall biosynthesis
LKLVLSIEAIHPPLAGIGRYAWELATRLPHHAEIDSVRYLSDGLWRDLPKLETTTEQIPQALAPSAVEVEPKLNFKGRMRQRLGRLPAVSRAYGQIMPYLARKRLDTLKEGVFHGPNYFVPETSLPTVVTIHDLSIFRYPQWHPKARIERMRTAIPETVSRANLVITDSLATRLEVIEEFGLRPENVVAVPLGVDAIFRPRLGNDIAPVLQKFGLSNNQYTLFVSTIEPRKNVINLLAAYRNLPEQLRRRWPLVLVGDKGWQSDEIHADLERGQNEGWLIYLGFVEQSYLPILYAGCRLFAYPSYYEGFGLPIAEAMASGVPVLTSNCSSMPEVAAGAAMLVEPNDVASIRDGLAQALEDEVWRNAAVDKGLKRAAQLTWDACVQNTVAAYHMVRGGK